MFHKLGRFLAIFLIVMAYDRSQPFLRLPGQLHERKFAHVGEIKRQIDIGISRHQEKERNLLLIHILHHLQKYVSEMAFTASAGICCHTHNIECINLFILHTDTVRIELSHRNNQAAVFLNQDSVVFCLFRIVIFNELVRILRKTGMPETFCLLLFIVGQILDFAAGNRIANLLSPTVAFLSVQQLLNKIFSRIVGRIIRSFSLPKPLQAHIVLPVDPFHISKFFNQELLVDELV